MTNKEKFEEIFGYEVDSGICPIVCHSDCPYYDEMSCAYKWWRSEFKRGEVIK